MHTELGNRLVKTSLIFFVMKKIYRIKKILGAKEYFNFVQETVKEKNIWKTNGRVRCLSTPYSKKYGDNTYLYFKFCRILHKKM